MLFFKDFSAQTVCVIYIIGMDQGDPKKTNHKKKEQL